MKQYLLVIFITLSITACGGGSSSSDPVVTPPPASDGGTNTTSSVISRSASYVYDLTEDVKYAEGLSHSDWNAPNPISMDLLLDVYEPVNEFTNRPAVMFIHGGGFTGGDKAQGAIFDMLSYLAERGFVGFSINYRLLYDYGTLPQEILEAADSFPGITDGQRDQLKAFYPAGRDAKAALRWLYANAETYGVDTSSVTVIGGSAGSFISMALGVTEAEDYRDELSLAQDPTLATTNLEQDSNVHSIVDHWGGTGLIDLLAVTYGHNRWDESDTPVSIVHGTEDPTVDFEQALTIRDNYEQTGAYYEFYPIEGGGHGIWGARVNGKSLSELALDFIVTSQELDIND